MMDCEQLIPHIEDYCDGRLDEADRRAVAAHLAECRDCARKVKAEQRWRELLRESPVSEPGSGFETRILEAVHGGGDARRRWSTPVAGAAMAACLVVGLFLGTWFIPRGGDSGPETVVGPVSENNVQTMRLAFDSGEALENVNLTIELPPHAELASFPGERRISWEVDLDKGENLLALPVRTLFPGEGELVARIRHGDRERVFRAPVTSGGEGG
ncbi:MULTISPECIES: anti-sigma factor family protein [Halomonadaceae]|uniref:Putative zinc-finger domain-containing protein n=1 Tax=Vreelandella halophila TaxID=86177 RepID=A0A9X5B6Z0_9GAMM|nr:MULTISPECIES: zf-HC2 domain-containing protein [Halomonas]MYL28034.1 hypothetical protein [Halomonas utahensis]MYL75799.1 hypothetical protein [Halomonas sp. 22501_18_FS]